MREHLIKHSVCVSIVTLPLKRPYSILYFTEQAIIVGKMFATAPFGYLCICFILMTESAIRCSITEAWHEERGHFGSPGFESLRMVIGIYCSVTTRLDNG